MSDHFDDDPRDETLARGLSALAPSEFDLDADQTLGSMRPALQRARMRRRLAVSTSVLGVLVVLGAGAVVVKDQSPSHVNIQGPSGSTVSTTKTATSTSRASTTTRPRPTTPTTTPADHTSTSQNGGGVIGGTRPTTPNSVPNSTPNSTPTSGTRPGDHGGTTPTTVAAPPSTKTYASTGGKATIRFANGKLTLVSYTAAAGYTPEVHTNKPDDIEVRFSNGNAESRIRVRVQDGQVEPEIENN